MDLTTKRVNHRPRTPLRSWRRSLVLGALSAALVLGPSLALPSAVGASSARTTTAPAADGTVSGTVTVTGAPKNFTAYVGVAACVGSTPGACPNPQYSLASQSSYSMTLAAGTWSIQGFYELGAFSGPFLGQATTVTVAANSSQTLNFTIAYSQPGVVHAHIGVANVPTGTTLAPIGALACPVYAPYTSGDQPLECTQSGGPQASFPTLPPGRWLIYPTYGSRFGTTVLTPATPVTVKAKHTTRIRVTAPYAPPTNGEIRGTATLVSSPTSNAPSLGVVACPGTRITASCVANSPFQSSASGTNGQYSIIAAAGRWTVAAEYTNSPYGGVVLGSPATLIVTGGTTRTRNLKVTYDLTGSVHGTLAITGLPEATSLEDTSVLACPLGFPANLGGYSPQCAGESSGTSPLQIQGSTVLSSSQISAGRARGFLLKDPVGVGSLESYSMELPAGQWLLYPSYSTIYGTTTASSPSTVTVASGVDMRTDLSIDYVAPTDGAITGTTTLFDAPSGSSPTGVQACSDKPVLNPPPTFPLPCVYSATSISVDGSYQLALPPGTWWINEIYQLVTPSGGGVFTGTQGDGPSQQVTIVAGVTTTLNLGATYGVNG